VKLPLACGTLLSLLLNGCTSYSGPRQSHERYPDTPTSTTQAPVSGRVITSSGVTRDTADRNDTRRDEEPSAAPYNSENDSDRESESENSAARSAPTTYNRPRPASAAPATNRAVSGALGSLVTQAQNAYKAGQYQTAISTAERGLRIDRRAAALYLVMAQSYLALNQPTQAAQFANQGLRFSQSGSVEARALEKVRNGAGG
jgi:tetratricopeptide (TPR) repeat protein